MHLRIDVEKVDEHTFDDSHGFRWYIRHVERLEMEQIIKEKKEHEGPPVYTPYTDRVWAPVNGIVVNGWIRIKPLFAKDLYEVKIEGEYEVRKYLDHIEPKSDNKEQQ
jgi:hypothetical protein